MEKYDNSWDLSESENGNLPENEEAFDKKYREWKHRSWESWLNENLVFPFFVRRMEDDDDAYFTDVADHQPFRLGHEMKALSIDIEDDLYGIILKVREGRRIGSVPLCDVEVLDQEDPNFWPVREYLVWFANRWKLGRTRRIHSDTQSAAVFDLYWQIKIKCPLQANRSFGCRWCAGVIHWARIWQIWNTWTSYYRQQREF